MQPRRRHPRARRHLPRRRREPAVASACSPPPPTCSRPSAAPTTGPTSSGRWRWRGAAGFETFNLDLIYGGAGETLDDWCRTLDDVVALDPPARLRLRASPWRPAPRSPLDPARHPDDDDQADKYLAATERLGAAGLDWYEISNWARPGHECRHNLLYWTMGEYQGVGCAVALAPRRPPVLEPAHARPLHRRRRAAAHSVEAADERLDADARALEALQLSLRTRHGVPAAALDADALPGLVAPHPTTPTASCSPSRAASSPTRSLRLAACVSRPSSPSIRVIIRSAWASVSPWPVTTWRNTRRSMARSTRSVVARTVAWRGTSRSRAISPKLPPGPRSVLSSSVMTTSACPASIT